MSAMAIRTTRLLPPPSSLPCAVPKSKPVPTHTITFYWKAKHSHSDRNTIGNITIRMSDNDEIRRLERITAWLRLKVGHGLHHCTLPLALLKEARRLSDLERMRRKWGKVMRAYQSDRERIIHGEGGLFIEERLLELEATMETIQKKVERTYGHRIEELDNAQLTQKARELDAQGLIAHTDYYHLS